MDYHKSCHQSQLAPKEFYYNLTNRVAAEDNSNPRGDGPKIPRPVVRVSESVTLKTKVSPDIDIDHKNSMVVRYLDLKYPEGCKASNVDYKNPVVARYQKSKIESRSTRIKSKVHPKDVSNEGMPSRCTDVDVHNIILSNTTKPNHKHGF